MKKILVILLALSIALSTTSCGTATKTNSESKTEPTYSYSEENGIIVISPDDFVNMVKSGNVDSSKQYEIEGKLTYIYGDKNQVAIVSNISQQATKVGVTIYFNMKSDFSDKVKSIDGDESEHTALIRASFKEINDKEQIIMENAEFISLDGKTLPDYIEPINSNEYSDIEIYEYTIPNTYKFIEETFDSSNPYDMLISEYGFYIEVDNEIDSSYGKSTVIDSLTNERKSLLDSFDNGFTIYENESGECIACPPISNSMIFFVLNKQNEDYYEFYTDVISNISIAVSDEQIETETIDGIEYELAVFDKYNSYASDNGLEGAKIYFKADGFGKNKMTKAGDGYYILCDISEKESWRIELDAFTSSNQVNQIWGDVSEKILGCNELTVYGVYLGYNKNSNSPDIFATAFKADGDLFLCKDFFGEQYQDIIE